MKSCIVSDSDDHAEALAHAVISTKRRDAEAVIHCGDLIGAHTFVALKAAGIPVHLIHGDNVGDLRALHNMARTSDGLIAYHGSDAQLNLGRL